MRITWSVPPFIAFPLRTTTVIALLLLAAAFPAEAVNRYAIASAAWNLGTTWSNSSGGATCNCVPLAGDDIFIGEGATARAVTIPAAFSTPNVASITIGNTGLNGVTSLTLSAATATLNVAGAVTVNNPGNNNINVLAVGAGTANLGSVSLGGGGGNRQASISISTGTATITNNIGITNGNSLVTFTGAGTLNIGGNFANGGTFTRSTGTVIYNGTGAQSVGTYTYTNLSVNKTAGTATLTGNTVITGGNVSVGTSGGTLDLSTFSLNRSAAGGTFTVVNGATLKIGGTNSFPTNYTTHTLGATSTVEYSGTNQNVAAEAAPGYGHLILNGAGPTKTAVGAFTVRGNLSITGVTFAGATFTHTVNGNVSNTGTHTATTGSITLNGGAAAHALSGTGTYANLVMNDVLGATLSASPTVSAVLTLSNGVIATGANTLVATAALCAAPSVTRTSGWVNGNLQKRIPANASVCTFEVGGASAYAPITATFVAGALASNITATSTDGDHAGIATSGLDPSLTANRSWSLTSTAAEATAFSAVFNFVAGDLDTDTAPATLFSGRSYSGGAWATPTTGTRTATSTQLTGLTLVAATQKDFVVGEAARVAGTGSFNVVENVAVSGAVAGHAITGKIFTKLAGTALSIDLVALNAARTAVDTTFKGAVKVELLDSSSGGAPDANGCNAGWGVIQTLGTPPRFLAADSGRKQNVSITESNAWPNVRVRVSSPAIGTATLVGCSGDNFSIRPPGIASVVGGAPLNMNNTGTSGAPSRIAGAGTFTLVAAAGFNGYTGTPKIDNTAVQAHVGAIQNGSVSGSFPVAISGTSTGTSAFIYSEVGNFRFLGYDPTSDTTSARGVYDDTFTAVDSTSDCTPDFSNALASGKYGCKFGIAANSGYFGRFYPKDFLLTTGTLTNRRAASCAPASTFTYAGEQFRVTFTLTARNGAGTPAITKNYDPGAGFASFDAAIIANLGFGAIDLADATPPLMATALSGSLTLGTSSGIWASGDVSVTADLMLTRAAAPDGPFESFNLGIDPMDADGVKLSSYNLDTSVPADTSDRGLVGNSKIRFGRLRLLNAYGSELLPLRVPVRAEYFNGTTWTLNAADNCTSLSANSFALSGGIAANTSASAVSLSGGGGMLTLAKPSPVATGSVDVAVNLGAAGSDQSCLGSHGGTAANMSWLRGFWAPAANCNSTAAWAQDPSARIKFGSPKAPYIYLRERY